MADEDEDKELKTRASARLGTVVRGKYRLDRVLGVGGMAVVYAATHRNQKQLAVKMLHPELSFREDIRNRFLREGYAANSVKHPGAVAVLDEDVSEEGAAFLVMELLEGESVETLWERSERRFSPRVVLALGFQLLDVLAAAHDKGIVHRDVKPPNLFLTRDGTLKVLDFGIARVRDVVAGAGSGAKTTGTGVLLGTPAFMPPEQALGKSAEIDGRTDVWAAGATLFTLLSGQLAHEGDNAPQLMVKAATTQARSVGSVAPEAPRPLIDVIDRALAFDREARWPSAAEMRDALARAHADVFGDPLTPGPLVVLMGAQVRVPMTLPSAPGPRTEPNTDPFEATAASMPALSRSEDARTPPPAGMITSQPVSSDAAGLARDGLRKKRRSRAIAGAAVAGVVAVVAIGAAFELGSRWSAPAAQPAPVSVAPVEPPSPTPPPVASPASVPTAPIASAPPPVPPPTASSAPATRPAHPSAGPPHAAAAPCKLVKTIDVNGEPHFSCPCATCQ